MRKNSGSPAGPLIKPIHIGVFLPIILMVSREE